MDESPIVNSGADRKGGTKLNVFGVLGILLSLAGFLVWWLCQRLTNDQYNVCIVPHILLQVSAIVLGVVAARRGSKWWLVLCLFALAVGIQAFLALAVE